MKVCMIPYTFVRRRKGAEVGIYELSRRILELGPEVAVIKLKFDDMKDRENICGCMHVRIKSPDDIVTPKI